MFSSAAFTFSGAKRPALIAVTRDAGPYRLRKYQAVALPRRAYGPHRLSVHLAEYYEAVLRLFILHAVAAREHCVGLYYLVRAAVEYLLKDGDRLARRRETYDVERDQRLAAHRVDVAQRVRRGDFSKAPRVVDDRRYEIYRQYADPVLGYLPQRRVLSVVPRREQPVGLEDRQPSQNFVKLRRSYLAAQPLVRARSVSRISTTPIPRADDARLPRRIFFLQNLS